MTGSRSLVAGLAVALTVLAPTLTPTRALAQAEAAVADAATLADLLQMDETFAIMAEEGLAHAEDLEEGYFPGRGGKLWADTVARIYDPAMLHARFMTGFEAALAEDPAALEAATAFFGSDLGQKIVRLELDARRAMIDEHVSEAAEVAAEKMQAARDPRLRLIRRFIEAGDLVETNVAGALSANLAFAQGLDEMTPPDMRQSADDLMVSVWGQEGAIRASTTTWLYSYLNMAYAPLSDDELQAYVDWTLTPEGQKVNAALFSAFDAAYVPVSRALGEAVGRTAVTMDL